MYIKNGFKNYKKTWEDNGIEVIVDSANSLWLNEKNIEKKIKPYKFTGHHKQIQQNIQKTQM